MSETKPRVPGARRRAAAGDGKSNGKSNGKAPVGATSAVGATSSPATTAAGAARVSMVLRSAGSPAGTGVLLCLGDGGEFSVGELASMVGRSVADLSRYLWKMTMTGLIAFRQDGKRRYYSATEAGRELARVARGMAR